MPANPALNAIPGETPQQYETRLGATNNPSTNGQGTGFGTPIQGFATQNINPQTGQPMPTYTPQQLSSIKQTLEQTANQGGGSLSSVPTKPTAPADPALTAPVAHEKFDLQAELAKLTAPVAPDMNATQANAEAQVGLSGIQTNLSTLTSQYANLQNDIQQRQAGEASKPGVIASIINGRMQMISAQDANAMAGLKSQITQAHTQLTQANTAVQSIMKNTQADYTTAQASYEKAFANTIAMYNAESNQQDKQIAQQDKVQTNAKANAQIIINSFKGSSAGINSITPDEEAQWGTLEQQAGMPSGTIKAAVAAELNVDKFIKGADGNTYINGTDNNGVPFTAKVGNAGGTTAQANVNVPSKAKVAPKAPAQTTEQKTVAAFNKSIATPPAKTETREQYARRLQAKYPDINPDDILRKVYEVYPDNYDKK